MVKIDEISRTSTFAWSQDCLPLLATGTVAGAVDVNFDSTSTLDLWDIFSPTSGNKPVFSASVDNRFYALAWSKPFEGRPKGLLAGAFENGVVEFWDAEVLIKSKDLSKASVHKGTKHSGPVKTLLFNPNQDHVLVTGGSNGEIFIWDTKKFTEPSTPGQAMTPMDEVTSVAWNNSVSHIFASAGNGGYTSIWDLKSKREVLHLSYNGPSGRANFSCVAWHPTQSTKLITASDNDGCPLILTWDLRNANAPEKIMEGHKKGVLSLDWCKQDPELLISSGKDNSTMLWNPIKGEKLGEYQTTANWAFHTKFAPAAPEIFATSSFDGKIIIQSLQDTSPPVSTKVASNDDNEFWNEISTTENQQPVFDVKQAPNWLNVPTSVSFGFGSKLVSVKKDSNGKSVVSVEKFVTNNNFQGSSDRLTEAFKANDFKSIIDSKLEGKFVNKIDQSDWELLKKLHDTGKDILFDAEVNGSDQELVERGKSEQTDESANEAISSTEDSFFDKLGSNSGNGTSNDVSYIPQGDFKIFDSKQSDGDRKLIKLILNKKIDEAVSSCLEQDKLVEALILALDSSDTVKEKVRNSFFKKNDNELARVLYSASSNNVTDIVCHADVENWKEIAMSISSFCVDVNEYNSKMTELGDRIIDSKGSSDEKRNNAILCYLSGNALGKIASIWLRELPELEEELLKSNDTKLSTPSDARYEALSNFVEKITAYRSISNISGEFEGPSIEPICKAILEYANLVAGYGQFDLAEKFLELVPSDFAGLKSERDRISKASGIKTHKQGATQSRNISQRPGLINSNSAYGKTNIVPSTGLGGFQSTPSSVVPPINPASMRLPQAQVQTQAPSTKPNLPSAPAANPYVKPASTNPYMPAHASNSFANPYKPATPSATQAANPLSPPPPGPPKASYKSQTEGWNDLPDTFKPKAAPRRAAAAAVSPSPVPSSPLLATGAPKRTSVAPPVAPPPPKGVSRNQSKTSISTSSANSPRQNHVQMNLRYAPPPGVTSTAPSTPGVNEFPPTVTTAPVPPPKNPYAPAIQATSPSLPKNPYAPPPTTYGQAGIPQPTIPTPNIASPSLGRATTAAPPKNPYAPPPASVASPKPNAAGIPAPRMGGVVPPPPMASSASSFPPPPSISQQPPAASPSITKAAEPEPPKYPPGDRSHMPEESLPIFNSLSNILDEIKPKIPERYAKHGVDMEKRINLLFDHLNNSDLLSDESIAALKEVCTALEAKDFATANALNIQIATNHSEEIGNWHTGVKRLIQMSEAL
ncbi:Protein transport protein SEC31 [Debaryomyces fabryi]|uniref:Protein transport protein SEC31 n=1 Tax=Debaryomyces fabryi TaxID=58627 RepID=A0A0V1PY63_9ASCO|nr:Protein transport protein SEC31 [Debaryomyces fabryi]KSA01052.1 Protein transport protein SEC31 [Debaryomyces fabryi]CUM47625.1 unnamed protein product [Debaryomyces fabryi]